MALPPSILIVGGGVFGRKSFFLYFTRDSPTKSEPQKINSPHYLTPTYQYPQNVGNPLTPLP